MKRIKLISSITLIVGILMISVGMVIQNDESAQALNTNVNISDFKIQNMAASANMIIQDTNKETTEENKKTTDLLTAVDMETAPASVIVPPRIEVYEGMTLEELAIKLDRNLGTDIVAGKGALIASECVNKGVDPYVAVAILLHEIGRASCRERV